MLRIALITNHPPPFRIPIYERIARTPGIELDVIFCSRREPNRQWELPPLRFSHTFLRERFVTRGSNFIHNNPDVVPELRRLRPDVIVTTGFNPTYLYAFAYAMLRGIPHVPMTDGTDTSEQVLTPAHRLLRKFIYSRSRAFISASLGGRRLYEGYGVDAGWFQSCLCVDNEAYLREPEPERKAFDFIFCGRIVPAKNPLFALDVARHTALKLGRRVAILFVGDGEQEDEVKAAAARHPDLIEAAFNGHAQQHELPELYRSARIFLFPTATDVWGVVANEACAAGLPVIVSPHAGVVGELVIDGENGYVCALDSSAAWAERAARLLTQPMLARRFSERSTALVSRYTFDHAAQGIIDACRHARGERRQAELRQASGNAG